MKQNDQRLEAKYRPTSWDDYVGNPDIIDKLQSIEVKGFYQMPCLLLAGPPGCGKSLAIEILSRNLKVSTKNLLYIKLNASDKRKLDDIRELKFIAEKTNPKIIFMDEFDAVTVKAQEALRVIMEDPAYNNTRWAISCNSPQNIISAIKSRCAVFRFQNHDVKTILLFLASILDGEGVEYDPESDDFQIALIELIESRRKDLRGCINQLSTIITEDGELTLQGVVRRAPADIIGNILMKAYNGDFKEAVMEFDDLLVQKNHDYRDFITIWLESVERIPDPDHSKRVYIALSEYADRCNRGSSARNHLIPFLAFVSLLKQING